jgi:predicted aconitase
VYLTNKEKDMIEGRHGPGHQRCMEILTTVGDCYGSEKMVPVTSVHIAGNYSVMETEGVEWLEELVQDGARVAVFTTKNPEMFDFEDWKEFNVPENLQDKQNRIDNVLRTLGVTLTYSCHHYLVGNLPKFGDYIAWASSGSQVYANSVIGARCNREGDHVAISAAVTGVIPEWGLHLNENRKGQVIIDTHSLNISDFNYADFQAMAWHIGKEVRDRIPVFVDLPQDIVIQNIKAILYSLTVTGAVALVHFVGITPEAPTIEAACGTHDIASLERITPTQKDVDRAYREISTAVDEKVDLVIFGCPQCTIQEIGEAVELLEGNKVHPETQLWICTSAWVKTLCKRMGYWDKIRAAGGRIVADIGAACGPYLYLPQQGVRVLAINSARGSYYSHNVTGMETWFGSTRECIETAISGTWRGRK